MTRRLKLAAVVALTLASGCSWSSTKPEKAATSADAAWLTGPKVEAVAYLSPSIYETNGTGALVAISNDGTTRSLAVGSLDNALIAAGPRRWLTYSSETRTTTIRGDRVDAWRRPAEQQTGHWTGIAGNRSVAVFNTGVTSMGYTTDVFITDGATRLHGVVPDVPGAAGATKNAVWVLSGGSSNNDGRVTLYKVSLNKKARVTTMQWAYRGARRGGSFSEASGIHAYRGRLWYLEHLGSSIRGNREGPRLGLAEVDPTSGKYVSHPLGSLERYVYDDADGVNRVAAAARNGHLHSGRLFTLNGDGAIYRVDLQSARLDVIGHVSDRARDSTKAAVAWSGGELVILGEEGSSTKDMFLETYSLETGNQTATLAVKRSAEFSRPEMVLWSMAVPQD